MIARVVTEHWGKVLGQQFLVDNQSGGGVIASQATARADMASAALVYGITSHTFDFDDTRLKTIIHPAGPVVSAVLALAEHRGAPGRDVIDVLVPGIDVACRDMRELTALCRP